ncbi:MAG: 3-oxoacyl-[acyl-carrier-protein] reductase [Candidatus Puniceispirillum sp. TMED52]|nr:3-oxoacyl-[acyl-carrier-protein] reductase [SAR116 cluster bacterium]OUU44861.1 MAG: 3-oxoacyl-[acyl-carrier-protein] reductase [Candidatus Puniceispirillum sp. TMED52]HCP19059.1 3-oxoacyl-[acyl-carrier-protein] reductase [Alphaproteobacteria bacterium]
MFDLSGKTALVTGASGGIGSEIAKALASRGANIILSGTRQQVLEDVASQLVLSADQKAEVITADLSDPEAAKTLIEQAGASVGAVDILVNNAGMARDGLLMRMKDEDWQSVLDINLTSVMRLSRAALRGMMKARWGRIIQISSIVGYTGNPGQTNYAASKAGMTGFTKSLALEVASRGVTANVVAPGFIQTAMTDALTEDQRAELVKKVPAGVMGQVEDIAAAVVYLASPEASYVTGATLHVNGGMAMI